mgnify:CR=1 FL=1
MEYITLNNGIKIPQLGLGTYLLKPDDAQSSVTSALGMGYELIDTANAYVNERAVVVACANQTRRTKTCFSKPSSGPIFTIATPPSTKRSSV